MLDKLFNSLDLGKNKYHEKTYYSVSDTSALRCLS